LHLGEEKTGSGMHVSYMLLFTITWKQRIYVAIYTHVFHAVAWFRGPFDTSIIIKDSNEYFILKTNQNQIYEQEEA